MTRSTAWPRNRRLRHHRLHHLRLQQQPPHLRHHDLHRAVRQRQNERDRRKLDHLQLAPATSPASAPRPTFTYNKANQMATGVLSGTTSTYLYAPSAHAAENHRRHRRAVRHRIRPGRRTHIREQHPRRNGLRLSRRHADSGDPAGSGNRIRHPHRPDRHPATRHQRRENHRLDRQLRPERQGQPYHDHHA